MSTLVTPSWLNDNDSMVYILVYLSNLFNSHIKNAAVYFHKSIKITASSYVVMQMCYVYIPIKTMK